MPSIDPPWKQATQKRRSQRSEREGAKADGGFTTAMSGAGRKKGDYHANGYLVEDKYTDAESFRIDRPTVLKTIREATQAHMLPMWRISIKGCPKLRVMREEDYLYLEARAARGSED